LVPEEKSMRKLLLATLSILAISTAGQAAVITDLGVDPTSATGHFSNNVFGATFNDQYTFSLSGATQFITFASATNDFVQASNIITNFTGQLFNSGLDGLPGGGDDFAVNPPASAVNCPTNPGGCQVLAGTALLGPGNYFLEISGTGQGTAGYGGDLTTTAVAAVPEPSTWAMMLLGFVGLGLFGMRPRSRINA
jgi:hypothetical protein